MGFPCLGEKMNIFFFFGSILLCVVNIWFALRPTGLLGDASHATLMTAIGKDVKKR